MRFLLWTTIVLAVAAKSAAQEPARPPDEDGLRKLVRDFSSDDPSVRDAASRALVAAGEAALPFLRKELAAGGNREPEADARLRECILAIERALRWKRPPEDDIGDWVKKHPCGCEAERWRTEEVTDDRLTKYFPTGRFFHLFRECCKDRRGRHEFLGVFRGPDAVERTTGKAGFATLKAHIRKVRNGDEAWEAADLVFALGFMQNIATLPLVGAYLPKVRVSESEKGWTFRYGIHQITFDADGALESFEDVKRK